MKKLTMIRVAEVKWAESRRPAWERKAGRRRSELAGARPCGLAAQRGPERSSEYPTRTRNQKGCYACGEGNQKTQSLWEVSIKKWGVGLGIGQLLHLAQGT